MQETIIVNTIDERIKQLVAGEQKEKDDKPFKPSIMGLLNFSLHTHFLIETCPDFNICEEYLKTIEK